jgi:uncharacterized beta-barrel protein YwiB (DUF1934 family)
MTKEVSITIEGLQLGAEEEPVVLKATGTYYFSKDNHYIQYEEREQEKSNAIRSTIKITPSQVTLLKKGEQLSQMVFDLEEITKTEYQTGYGSLLLDIRTKSIDLKEMPERLELKMSYTLSAGDSPLSENIITITIDSII